MATTTKVFKISVLYGTGANGNITIENPKDGIDGEAISAVNTHGDELGFSIKEGQYITTSKDDLIYPE